MTTDGDHSSRSNFGSEPRLSRASVGRLSLYLRRLEAMLREGSVTVSSGQLGDALGVTAVQVRKDLAPLGNLGHPGIGYAAPELVGAIRRVLGIDREWRAALVGVGNLGRAIFRHHGFAERGFRIVALFDVDEAKIGQRLDDLVIHPVDRMSEWIAKSKAELGLLTVPAAAAQMVADALLAAGVRGLLNFAPGVLRVPPGVSIVSVDLTVQLEQLAFLVQMSGTP